MKIEIAIAWDNDGNWNAMGWQQGGRKTPIAEFRDTILDCWEQEDDPPFSGTIEVDIPVPLEAFVYKGELVS